MSAAINLGNVETTLRESPDALARAEVGALLTESRFGFGSIHRGLPFVLALLACPRAAAPVAEPPASATESASDPPPAT